MILKVEPMGSALLGEVDSPGDKSISHRALIFASLAEGRSELSGLLESEDTLATSRACEQLGAKIERRGERTFISGLGGVLKRPPTGFLEMGNSGTAIRLLAGVLCGQGFSTTLSGDTSLNRRPMRRVVEPLTLMGADIRSTGQGTAPLVVNVCAGLTGIEYASPVASAQIKSCVLLAGLFASGVTRVTEPRLSRDHTERMLPVFGVDMPGPCSVTGGSRLKAADFTVPGDVSSAVFPLAAAAMMTGSKVISLQTGLNPTRVGFLRCLEEMGAQLEIVKHTFPGTEPVGDIQVTFNDRLQAIDVPETRVPEMIDELPLLMAVAATAEGVSRIRGAAELRVKESDRLAVMASGLRALGVELVEYPDGMDIKGGSISGGCVDAAGDHRCAMSLALLGLVATGSVKVDNAEYIATSYPEFSADMNRLGASMRMDTDGLQRPAS